jgi:hypothetical protein
VSDALEHEAPCQSQACSPAQNDLTEESEQCGEDPEVTQGLAISLQTAQDEGRLQFTEMADEWDMLESHSVQGGSLLAHRSNGVGKNGSVRRQADQPLASKENQVGGQGMVRAGRKIENVGGQAMDEWADMNGNRGGRPIPSDSVVSAHPPFSQLTTSDWVDDIDPSEGHLAENPISGERPMEEKPTHLLKSLLPESQSGWWEVDAKGKGLVAKFRWRVPHGSDGPERQTLLFPKFTPDQIKTLEEKAFDEAVGILRERIASDLQKFSLDPARQGKAFTAAEKLGICLDCVPGLQPCTHAPLPF